MSESWVTLWTNDRCRWLKRCGEEGMPLNVIFGGVHLSVPSLRNAGVRAGDTLFPVRVFKGDLHIVAAIIAREYVELKDYVVNQFKLMHDDVAGLHEYELMELLRNQFPTSGQYLPHGCGIETLVGNSGAPIRFDRAIPSEVLEDLVFCSKRARLKLKRIVNGKLTSSLSLQGHVRRLSPESARIFQALVGLRQDGD